MPKRGGVPIGTRKALYNPDGKKNGKTLLFVTSGLGGMSGAQPKAGNIAGVVTICAEIDSIA